MDGVRDHIVGLLQDYAAEAERLGQAFAGRNRMHPTDLYALLAVLRAEANGTPLTPGRLGAHLGLSSGATTAVLDRLGRADLVRRAPDDRDRRRTTLHLGAAASRIGMAFFGPLGERMDAMLGQFSEAELAVVVQFLEATNAVMREQTEGVAN